MVYKINYSITYLMALLLFTCLSLKASTQPSLLIQNVKLFDGEQVQVEVDLLIKDGIVAKIEQSITVSASSVVDGRGKTIIPGLVNAHVHAWIPYHLENAFEAGVYTLFDMHGPAEVLNELKSYDLKDGYAQLYAAGYAATVNGGHGTQYGYVVPTIGPDRTPEQFINESLKRGSDYIKILYEPSRKNLSLGQVRQIIDLAHQNNLLAVAHISNIADAERLVDLGIDALVHLWKDGPLTEKFLEKLKEGEVFVIPTISLTEAVIEYYEKAGVTPKISSLDSLLGDIKKLSNGGVQILAGTDPPNLLFDYGSSLYKEFSLFASAGMHPVEILKSATSSPGKCFGIEGLGMIQEGSSATFLLIDGDPTERIEDIQNINSKWVNGQIIENKTEKQ